MAGLVGIISRVPSATCQSQLSRMLSTMWTEDFYSQGTYIDEDLGLYAGWKCHAGSFNDCLPIFNERRDCSLIILGEVFPGSGEISDLRSKGHEIPRFDASYLVHSFEESGINFLAELNGTFSGVVADRRTRQCFLFNDRYGIRRLFIHENSEGIYFASQVRSLLAVFPTTREFDPVGLSEFITCGCTLGERSLFRNVSVLPGASLWTANRGEVNTRKRYFCPSEWEGQDRLEPGRFNEDVETLFPRVSRKYAGSTLPVGISLTAGIDTRMLIASLDTRATKHPCYTFGSMYRDTFDVSIARRISQLCGLPHESIILGNDFLGDFQKHLERAVLLSGGYIGLLGAASLYANSRARKIAPIRLTGNFGSELFRGVRAFKSRLPKTRFYETALDPNLVDALTSFKGLLQRDPISFSLFVQAPCQGFGLLSIEESQLVMRTPCFDNDLVHLMYQGPRSYSAGLELSISIIGKNNQDLLNVPTDFGYLGLGGRIKKSFRRTYHQFLFKGEYWSSRGLPSGAAAFFHLIPRLSPEKYFLGRHKYQHYQIWIKRELSELVKDLLVRDRDLPNCFDRRNLIDMVNKHLGGRYNYLDEIDKSLTILLAYKILLSRGSPVL